MSLITEEQPPGLLYMPHSPQPHPTPVGDYDRPEMTTVTMSPPLKQAGYQKTTTVTGTVCAVCGEASTKEAAFRKHYGVVCCEACKCFFRRTVQMSRDYKCRYDGRCSIGRCPENMKQVCQACRYSQCIRAGMKVESVKKFPRKGQGRSGDRENGGNGGNEDSKDQAKFQRVLKNFSKGKKKEKTGGDVGGGESEGGGRGEGGGAEVTLTSNGSHVSPHLKQESDLDLDPDLEQLKYSPEFHSVLGSAVPQVFNYNSPVPEGGSPQPAPAAGSNGLLEGVAMNVPMPHPSHAWTEGPTSGKRQAQEVHRRQAKKMRLEAALSHIHPHSPPHSVSPFSPPPLTQSAPYTPPSFQQPPHYPSHPYSHPGSVVNSPESHPPSVYSSHANTPYATPHVTPHATPHVTPHGTPVHSPLPSPTAPPSLLHAPPSLHPYPPPPATVPSLTSISLPRFSQRNNLLISQSPGAVFLNSSPQMPFRVLPMAQPLLPFMASFPSFTSQVQPHNGEPPPRPSPFSVVPIPSSATRPSQPLMEAVSELPQPSLCLQKRGEVEETLASAPPSARASPEPPYKPPRSITGDTFPEAEVDEVLDSLRQRIRTMFSWAKFDVAGFEDLSPLDQKALLRRTVAELVMLGFARASIAYTNVLLLGKTGKAIRPSNSNSGVSAVASVTLKKLVEPLKVVNMDDNEYSLMMEIVLFNPESSCLRNREVVRAHRKRSHISLKEYTDKQGDVGRFGELMCLLTPLFEVSTEVTEQLRLEHFVHEGEARIDALLLMSMINGAEEVGAA